MARMDKSEVTRGIFYRGSDVECQLLYVIANSGSSDHAFR